MNRIDSLKLAPIPRTETLDRMGNMIGFAQDNCKLCVSRWDESVLEVHHLDKASHLLTPPIDIRAHIVIWYHHNLGPSTSFEVTTASIE
jgi:hypothetical protein